jgi:hypothetical protein
MTELRGYGDRYASEYDRRSFETVLVEIRRRHVLKWMERYQAQEILEVGCGLEPLFSHYGDFTLWRTVEPVSDFATRARDLARGDERIEVLDGGLEERVEALADERFDFITVSGVVHELQNPLGLLGAVRSLCADTTTVHFNVPNMLSFHRLLGVEMGLIEDVTEASELDREFGRPGRFDSGSFGRLLTDAGFNVIESGTYFVKPFTNEQMDVLLGTGAFPRSLVDGLDRITEYMPEHGCELYANARKA